MNTRPSLLLTAALVAAACCLVAGVAYVSCVPRAVPSSIAPPAPSGAPRAPARIPAPVPVDLLPTPALAECLARLPQSADFQSIPDFAEAPGDLHVAWQLPQGLPGWASRGEPLPSTAVRLTFEAGGARQTLTFGAYPGRPWARELSACRGTQPSGPCRSEPVAAPQGVVSEFSMQYWDGYLPGPAAWWMLVRTPSAMVLLKATGREVRVTDDRGLCTAGLWRRLLEITLSPTATVREQVLLGDPPKPFDCAESYQGDSRCAG